MPDANSNKPTDSKASGDAGENSEEKKTETATADDLDEEILRMSTEDIIGRTRLLDNEIRIMRSEVQRISHDLSTIKDKIKVKNLIFFLQLVLNKRFFNFKDNKERIKVNKTLPYLVSNVIELLDLDAKGQEDQEGANVDLDASKTKCAVIKTSTRATYFLPVIGLVDAAELKPGELVGVNKDSYLILEKLPAEYDSRVKVNKATIVLSTIALLPQSLSIF